VKASADPARTFWPALFASEREDWATPPELVKMLEADFGTFDLDPCATAASAKAPRFHTLEDDGLAQSWAPGRVFLNPPYGKVIGKWVHKARLEGSLGALVVALIPARTDTRWWHGDVEGHAALVRFLPRRVRFIGPDGARVGAPFPSAVIVWGGLSEIPSATYAAGGQWTPT
jgi:phage N-6-adenine-methyltransferase